MTGTWWWVWQDGDGRGTVCITQFCIFGPCSFVPLRSVTTASQKLGFNLLSKVFLTRPYVELTIIHCFQCPDLCLFWGQNVQVCSPSTSEWFQTCGCWTIAPTGKSGPDCGSGWATTDDWATPALAEFHCGTVALLISEMHPPASLGLDDCSLTPLSHRPEARPDFCLGIQTPALPQISHTLLRPLAALIFFIVSSENEE